LQPIRNVVDIISLNLLKGIQKKLDTILAMDAEDDVILSAKIKAEKQIGAVVKTYNEFLGTLYAVLDLKKKEFLPVAKYYLIKYFTDYAKLKSN
jgi:hypothetical protein